MERVYSYEPLERLQRLGLEKGAEPRIRGVQAALWSETVATPARAEEMLFPRLLAVAEIGWTAPERRDYVDFKWRLPAQLAWLQRDRGVIFGGETCGLLLKGELMRLDRAPPPGSGSPAGIAALTGPVGAAGAIAPPGADASACHAPYGAAGGS